MLLLIGFHLGVFKGKSEQKRFQTKKTDGDEVDSYRSSGSLRTPKEKRSRAKRLLFSTVPSISGAKPEHQAISPN
jgi:hypothetical protein